MKTSAKIQSMVLVLIFLMGISLFFLISMEKSQQANLVFLKKQQTDETLGNILNYNSLRYSQQVNDYSYWDEMCNFVKTKDESWAEENLATIVHSYDIDQVLIISPDSQAPIYSYPFEADQIPEIIQDSKNMLRDLYRKRLLQSYTYNNKTGLIGRIYAATIHPTNDPQRLTKPQGYIFLCKYWDHTFIQNLEQISGSQISVVKKRQLSEENNEAITLYKEIKDYSGIDLAYLKIVQPAPFLKLNSDFSANVLLIYSLSALFLLLIVSISQHLLIGKPLQVLGRILKGEKQMIPKLKKSGGEYVQIADIIQESNTTHDELAKAKLRAEESDRLKTAFLANISHEIRSPMNAIMGFSYILPEHFDDKAQLKECTDIIYQRSMDLLDIVNSIIDISKINTGSVELQTNSSNITSLFEELDVQFKKIRNKSGKEHIDYHIRTFANANLEPIVADFNKLKEIFVHLLSNAFKFTDEGTIEAGCLQDPEKGLVFFVSDTGNGIPIEMQSIIFNKFTRLNYDLTNNQSGTGLGLSIVKGLIDLMEGEIWLKSETGKGTTFYFTVPYAQSPSIS